MNEKITLYTTGCPKCRVLEGKLKAAGIEFDIVTDIEEMKNLGIISAPAMMIGKAGPLDFSQAIRWGREKTSNS